MVTMTLLIVLVLTKFVILILNNDLTNPIKSEVFHLKSFLCVTADDFTSNLDFFPSKTLYRVPIFGSLQLFELPIYE